MKKVEDMSLKKNMTVEELINGMYEGGGFTAKKVGVAEKIIEDMLNEECTVFLSFPADIISTGVRGVIRDIVKMGLVDVLITTCGMLDHDIARAYKDYYHGKFEMNDAELHKKEINRLGNILIPNECYGEILEKTLQPIFNDLYAEKKEWNSTDLINEVGKKMPESTILYNASKNNIPIFVPGITDGAFGSQLWSFWEMNRDFKLNIFEDEHELSNIIFDAKKTGAIMIGGGISKHHTIWWNQFRDGLDYAVFITTAVEHDGSLSGARIREAVSWGKMKEDGKYVTVEGDATIILPLLFSSIVNKLENV